jgi:hypothetical protein
MTRPLLFRGRVHQELWLEAGHSSFFWLLPKISRLGVTRGVGDLVSIYLP